MKYSMVFILIDFIYMLIIAFIYFKKRKIESVEVKLYNAILIFCLVNIIVEFLLCLNILEKVNLYSLFNLALNRTFLILLFAWFTIFTLYVLLISSKKKLYLKSQLDNLNYKKPVMLLIIYIVICCSFLVLLPIDLINDGVYAYSNGLAVSFLTVILGLNIMSWVGLILYNIKNLNIKKYIPVFVSVVVLFALIILRQINPGILLNSFSVAITTFIMYHTIENPDVKLLEEYVKNKELAEKNIEDKSNMLFRITQDIKAPATKIEVLSHKITNDKTLDDAKDDACNVMLLAKGVNNTINNVLDISEIDLNSIKFTTATYNLYNLFNQLILLMDGKIKPGVEFKYSLSSVAPKILYGDSSRIKQIIYSILRYSSKKTLSGYIDLDISAIIKYDVCRLLITISDTASPMSLDKINKIMDNSEKLNTDELAQIKDLEIDLKLVKKMIDMLGGTFFIKNEGDRGNVFTIILNQKMKLENSEEALINNTISILSNKKKILLVDDDYEELEVLGRELKKNNYEVVSTMYPNDCVEKLRTGDQFDYIFLDDEMNDKNSVELIKEIDTSKVKVIVMLNKAKETIKDHYLKDYPFSDYLLKDDFRGEIKRIKEQE